MGGCVQYMHNGMSLGFIDEQCEFQTVNRLQFKMCSKWIKCYRTIDTIWFI